MIEIVETDRFILRETKMEDKNKIFEVLNNEEVIKTLNLQKHKTIDDTEELLKYYFEGIEENSRIPYTIIDKKSGEFIGVFLFKIDLWNEDSYEFTIYLSKKSWGNGVYTEVLPYMVKVAFEKLNTKNFRGYAMEKNIASIKVLEKTKFKLENILNVDGIEDKVYSYLITEDMYMQLNQAYNNKKA